MVAGSLLDAIKSIEVHQQVDPDKYSQFELDFKELKAQLIAIRSRLLEVENTRNSVNVVR
jgi:hypothetical protein